ncbi:hypothetical protein PYCCODRAFT_1098452 [Trametes coccinea BRFM310]|uniref:Uncharacterized protein n=1 Tax=Trametes coccinea (strain BRFM310) TaxID=1353009 RepID=A0A1Y2ID95_TRAC3|nr:hypothetical protein PYCCODRAFT_1098452 [Trametes coccinea BRFM310]
MTLQAEDAWPADLTSMFLTVISYCAFVTGAYPRAHISPRAHSRLFSATQTKKQLRRSCSQHTYHAPPHVIRTKTDRGLLFWGSTKTSYHLRHANHAILAIIEPLACADAREDVGPHTRTPHARTPRHLTSTSRTQRANTCNSISSPRIGVRGS